MDKTAKINEAQVQLDNREHYKTLKAPMVKTTQEKVNEIINLLHRGKHIDDMTKKWLSQTPNPPRIPVFYTLTKVHKPTPVGRPIISGCDGPTERISSFVDTLLQPISENQITFLDTVVFKGERFTKDSILDIKTHYKPTETFQYTHFTSCHPPGVKKGFIKGEAMRLLRTNSSKTSFEECLMKFKQRLQARGYPKTLVERSLSGVTFASRQSALTKKKHDNERLLPFVTTYQPAVKKLKQILMEQWSLIQNQPLLKTIYKKPPIISYKRGKSLKDTLVRAKI